MYSEILSTRRVHLNKQARSIARSRRDFFLCMPRGVTFHMEWRSVKKALSRDHHCALPTVPYRSGYSPHQKDTEFFFLVQVRTIARHHTVNNVGIERAKIMAWSSSTRYSKILNRIARRHHHRREREREDGVPQSSRSCDCGRSRSRG